MDMTKTQIERLGIRLASSDSPRQADLDCLHLLLASYDEVLNQSIPRVRDGLNVSPSSRIKNTGTILEKLERYGGSWLKSIQDLAGMRIVGSLDRPTQDNLVKGLVDLFSDETRQPKVIDRRIKPMNGYRAVHVIVFPQGVPIEIQVRTRWQHEWADLFEKLADRIGRGIRYGERPAHWRTRAQLKNEAPELRVLYNAQYALNTAIWEEALIIAELIDAVERAEQQELGSSGLMRYRQSVRDALSHLHEDLADL
jgi:ppGpp synthetase/RelA/SpoT-type nucleotidyltranferase